MNVPSHKCSNYSHNHSLNLYNFSFAAGTISFFKVRAYSTSSSSKDNNEFNHDKFIPSLAQVIYDDVFFMKKAILKDNAGKAGIYMFTNKTTGDIYVGQSIDLCKRFLNYFNLSYINKRNELVINRALIKCGYSNFSLTILEYCDKSDLDVREQHYFDTLNPKYNIQKVAGGSSRGLILSEETPDRISKALKGVYKEGKAYWYGRKMDDATKKLMSSKRRGKLNPLYDKSHSDEAKELMREKALGRKYSEETKLLMSTKRGNPVNIYEKFSSEGFKLIGSFVSARRAGKFLEISGSTVISYMRSGAVFKDRYKFSSK
uniref:GIY-YIG endonuclease n=1 Tax=Monilinia fructicola TaxID=38448 RepID=A0A889XPR5_MONFR|nr:GIY-YIG endonuclease [Monilinia fructicola]QRF72234.1 GIY-YIG endonuclease [Monilinia fructicola]QYB19425.1 GIY-YIG endonuclease [Monilinia fructicola]QYB19486.1 GIY-YIG endonuclease [Monilinia fructicola]QYB19548.1 GIY-YIG endonuclease [Monilinia fructicola]QYB19610.1 GIY-YIG endonuclease [Monilinia fructicola]